MKRKVLLLCAILLTLKLALSLTIYTSVSRYNDFDIETEGIVDVVVIRQAIV